jgi:hypothetical protein
LKTAGALIFAAGAIAAGCGGGDEDSESLASLTPPDVPFYAEAVIRPEGDQAEAVEAFTERLGGIADPGGEVVAAIDESLSENGLDATYADDIEPWLGDDAAMFVSSFEDSSGTPDYAVMAEADDGGAASEFLANAFAEDGADPTEYEGTEYYVTGPFAVGVVDDRALAFGSENGLKVVIDAANGQSLAESDEYTERMDELPGDGALAAAFFEPAAAIEASIAQGELGPIEGQAIEPLLGGPLSHPIAATLTATTESASIDLSMMVDGEATMSSESTLLSALPGGSWFAAALPDIGPALERTLEQLSSSGLPGAGEIERHAQEGAGLDLGDDVFGWLGDAAVFVEGTAPPAFSAGLVAETTDPKGPRALLAAVQRWAERDSGLTSSGPPEGSEYGFSLGIPGVGGGAEAGVIGDQLVAVLGATVDQVLDPDRSLGDDPEYQAAVETLGEDFAPALYVSLPEFFRVAEQGADGDVDYDELRPYVGAFASLVAGASVDDGHALSRITVLLGDE